MSARHNRLPQRTARTRRSMCVIVEGETEEQYLKRLARDNREVSLTCRRSKHPQPLQVVQAAVKEKRLRSGSRSRPHDFDEYWCVFDHDDDPSLQEALHLAARHGIHVALTVPCLELWFVWHFEDVARHVTCTQMVQRSEALLGCGKPLDEEAVNLLLPETDAASHRARSRDPGPPVGGTYPTPNPSSGLWRLVEQVRA